MSISSGFVQRLVHILNILTLTSGPGADSRLFSTQSQSNASNAKLYSETSKFYSQAYETITTFREESNFKPDKIFLRKNIYELVLSTQQRL